MVEGGIIYRDTQVGEVSKRERWLPRLVRLGYRPNPHSLNVDERSLRG